MRIGKIIKYNLSKIAAITERNVKIKIRFKGPIIMRFITPIFTIFVPIFILGKFFEYNTDFGQWNATNFLVYQFVAIQVITVKGVMGELPAWLKMEKIRQTLPTLIIAPFNRFDLLIANILSYFIYNSLPLIITFILCYIYFPISFFTVAFLFFLYLLLTLGFGGIGMILGIFAVSNENLLTYFNFIISILIMFSSVTFPFQIFPEPVQTAINLNPFYYIFDIARVLWVEDNFLTTLVNHPIHFLILFTFAIVPPLIGIPIFNKVYNKYGIVGL